MRILYQFHYRNPSQGLKNWEILIGHSAARNYHAFENYPIPCVRQSCACAQKSSLPLCWIVVSCDETENCITGPAISAPSKSHGCFLLRWEPHMPKSPVPGCLATSTSGFGHADTLTYLINTMVLRILAEQSVRTSKAHLRGYKRIKKTMIWKEVVGLPLATFNVWHWSDWCLQTTSPILLLGRKKSRIKLHASGYVLWVWRLRCMFACLVCPLCLPLPAVDWE